MRQAQIRHFRGLDRRQGEERRKNGIAVMPLKAFIYKNTK